jgi:hypothetical protein
MRTAGANGTNHSDGRDTIHNDANGGGTIHSDANGGGTRPLSLRRRVKIAVLHRWSRVLPAKTTTRNAVTPAVNNLRMVFLRKVVWLQHANVASEGAVPRVLPGKTVINTGGDRRTSERAGDRGAGGCLGLGAMGGA